MAQQQLTPEQSAELARQQQAQANRTFLALGQVEQVKALAQNGTQFLQQNNLIYEAPTVNGYMHKMTVKLNLEATYSPAGSNPKAKFTQAGLYALINRVQVSLGNPAHDIHPYFAKIFQEMKGTNKTTQNEVIGFERESITQMFHKEPTINEGKNDWVIEFDVDFTHLGNTVFGLLPMGSTGTPISINLNTGSVIGKDPLLNVVDTNGSITVSGNVEVICHYRSGKSLSVLETLSPNLSGLPTIQTIKPSELSPLSGGVAVHKRIGNPYKFLAFVSLVIDGQKSDVACEESNINFFSLEKSDNESDAFYRFDSRAGGTASYYRGIRSQYQRDFDPGVLIGVHSQVSNILDASNYTGEQILSVDKYPAARFGYGVETTSHDNGITPRVVSYGIILNNEPLSII